MKNNSLLTGLIALSLTACGHVGSGLMYDDFPGIFSRHAFKEKSKSLSETYTPPKINKDAELIDAFPKENFFGMKDSLNDNKLALAIITENYDTNGVTKDIEKLFQNNFENIPEYKLMTQRVKNYDEFFNSLRDYSELKSIDVLILVMHGNDKDIAISYHERIATYNVERLLKDYASTISSDGIIIVYSCDAGKDGGVAEKIADAMIRDVQAFKHTYFPESYLKSEERVGEFVLDNNNRLSLNISALKLYESITNNNKKFCSAIGTDGFKNFNGENTLIKYESPILIIDK
jgi:hypothetical protein